MSTLSPSHSPPRGQRERPLPVELARLLRRGAMRLRCDRALVGGMTGGAAGLLVALGLAIVVRVQPVMLQSEAVPWSVGIVFLGVALGSLVGWSWPAPLPLVARRADSACGLRERVSTAFELHRSGHPGPLVADQLRDAIARASLVTRIPRLGPAPTRRDLMVIAALLLAVALALGLPNPTSDTVWEQRADAAAIEEARESIAAATTAIDARTDLDPATRAMMTDRLEDLLAVLDPGSLTRQDAAADIAAAEADLRRMDTGAADAQAAALRNAAPLLQTSGATANLGNALAAGDLIAAADAMAALGDESQALSPEEQQALGNRLNELAAQQQDVNPELASALAAAAAALASGNPSQASASLQQAAAAIQAVADAQAASSAVASAGAALANARQALGEPGRAGSSRSATGGTPRAATGQAGSGSASGTPRAGDGSSGSGSSGGSGTPGAGSGQSGSAGGNMGMSGQVAGSSAQTTTGGTNAGNAQPRQGEAGTTGSRDEEPIYAPSTQSGARGQDEFIAGIEGPGNEETSAQSGTGLATESQVPYATVYGEYEREAARDLEQGAVPAPLQPYVRDYFSALEPGSGGTTAEDDQP